MVCVDAAADDAAGSASYARRPVSYGRRLCVDRCATLAPPPARDLPPANQTVIGMTRLDPTPRLLLIFYHVCVQTNTHTKWIDALK